MTETRKVCVCHGQPAETRKGKYYCPVEHRECMVETKKMVVNLPNKDDTWDGSEVCPEDLQEMLDDYDFKKKASGE